MIGYIQMMKMIDDGIATGQDFRFDMFGGWPVGSGYLVEVPFTRMWFSPNTLDNRERTDAALADFVSFHGHEIVTLAHGFDPENVVIEGHAQPRGIASASAGYEVFVSVRIEGYNAALLTMTRWNQAAIYKIHTPQTLGRGRVMRPYDDLMDEYLKAELIDGHPGGSHEALVAALDNLKILAERDEGLGIDVPRGQVRRVLDIINF